MGGDGDMGIHDKVIISLPYWQALALWALMKSPGYRRDPVLQVLAEAVASELEEVVIP